MPKYILQDVSGETYELNIDIDKRGVGIVINRPGELSLFEATIENNMGELNVFVWDADDIDNEPTEHYTPSQTPTSYCLKCGAIWGVHRGDGACEEGL